MMLARYMGRCEVLVGTLLSVLTLTLRAADLPPIRADVNTVERDGAGPGVATLVQGSSTGTTRFVESTYLAGACWDNPSWNTQQVFDRRFGPTVTVDIEPGSWFVKWTFFALDDRGCNAESEVLDLNSKQEKILPSILPARYSKYQILAYERGKFDFQVSIVEDKFVDSIEPAGTPMQLQLLASNRSNDTRVLAITGKHINCSGQETYDWTVGPGEAPNEVASGPTLVAAGGWVAFSQRIRGKGDPARCTVELQISELLRASESPAVPPHAGLQPRWMSVGSIASSLKPTAKALYRP